MSSLYIKAENSNGRTVLSDCRFTSPLKIAKPFYRGEYTEIIMMVAGAGMLEGDHYDISIDVGENASLIFTGQSYTKLFKSEKSGSSQRVKINVQKNGKLLYFPRPVIPFADSIYNAETEVRLDSGSEFALCDIISCGRAAMNEKFLFKSYISRTSVFVDEKLVFLDNVRLVPAEIPLAGTGFFEHYSHIGMMYIYRHDVADIPEITETEAAVSKALNGICIRAASNNADALYTGFLNAVNIRPVQ